MLIIHLLVGAASAYTSILGVVLFYLVLFQLFIQYSRSVSKERTSLFISILCYVMGFEVFGRMMGADPYIPWEVGKYLMFLFFLSAIFKPFRGAGFWILALSLPGCFAGKDFEAFVFNGMGILILGLGAHYFYGRKIDLKDWQEYIKWILYPIFGVVGFITVRRPDYSDIQWSLSAHFETTGGFGSNQVSTVLGLAFLLLFMNIFLRTHFLKKIWMDGALALMFLFHAILTFSRGGVVSAILPILLSGAFTAKKVVAGFSLRKRGRFLLVFLLLSGVFYQVNNITGGAILARYSGDTEGTLKGSKEKNLSTITTGRWDIFLTDLAIFKDHLYGVGVGNSVDMRPAYGHPPALAHVEVSRLLSEHGLFGIIITLILLARPIMLIRKDTTPLNFTMAFCLSTFAIFTTMHAAMRTMVASFLFGMSFANFTDDTGILQASKENQ